MTENEKELIRIIRNSKDPAKAMARVVDMIAKFVAGESLEDIAASYGIVMTADGRFERA
jgi:hypothetical protein